MGDFLAATAIRGASVAEVVQAISQYLPAHDVKFDLLTDVTSPSATDARVFAPENGWTVVLWPAYFNVHDFPLAQQLARDRGWLISSIHVCDGDYWEHLAVDGPSEVHSFCSRPHYWDDASGESACTAHHPEPDRLAALMGIEKPILDAYLIDADELPEEDAKAHADDQFELADFWVFTDFWRRLGIVYPDPPENPETTIRLSKWFSQRLPGA
jgi:hypothetical protein